MTSVRKIVLAGVAATAISLAGAARAGANLVHDGSFEGSSGGVISAAWSHNGWAAATGGPFNDAAPDGAEFAATLCEGASCTDPDQTDIPRLSQTIDGLTAGGAYELTFQYDPDVTFHPPFGANELKVLWDGVQVLDLPNLPTSGFQGFAATVTAQGGGDVLTFLARSDASEVGLDAVSLTRNVAGVPEPAAWVLMIGGFGFAGAALRRAPRRAA